MIYTLFDGLSKPFEGYREILYTISIDDRVHTISKDRMKRESDHSYKIVAKDDHKLTKSDVEDIVLSKIQEFRQNPENK